MKVSITHTAFRKRLISGLLLVNFIVFILVLTSILQSRSQYEERANIATQNLTKVLEENIRDGIDKVNLALLAVTEEMQRELNAGGIKRRTLNEFIMRQKNRIKLIESLRVNDKHGWVRYGSGISPRTNVNLSDREHFIIHRDNPDAGLFIGKPLFAKISKKWALPISRRINRPDGAFAGTVYANIELKYFSELFSTINVGKYGAISMSDTGLRVIARYPNDIKIESSMGYRLKAARLLELLQKNINVATYVTRGSIDNIKRVYSYRKISGYPLYIFVGVATDDYLAEWRENTVKIIALLVIFILVTIGFAWFVDLYVVERKRAEKNNLKLSMQNKMILNTAGEGICGLDNDGNIIFANPSAACMCGYTVDEMIGNNIHTLLHHTKSDGSEYPIEQCPHYQTLKHGTSILPIEDIFWKKDGTSFYVLHSSTAIKEHDDMTGGVVTFMDITDRKDAERLRLETEQKFTNLFAASPDFVAVSDIETGMYYEANGGLDNLFGYSREDLVGKTVFEIGIWADTHQREKLVKEVREKGECLSFDSKFRGKDGKLFDASISSRLLDFGGRECMLSIVRDITEKVKLEEQLRHSQKLETIGILAGGVAHDFNNIIGAIIGFASLLEMETKESSPKRRYLDNIISLSDRASTLTRSLLAFSRKQVLEIKPTSLNEVVSSVSRLLISVIGEHIKVDIRLSPEDPVINGDGSQLENVLINLVTNSRDAMPEGGELNINTALVQIDDEFIKMRGYGERGRYALLSVQDTGYGIDEETRDRIFAPFFTTKKVGKGTGLGLAMVYGTVKQHNGYIDVSSKTGKGTTFNIYLPVLEDRTVEEKTVVNDSGSGGEETILLVEDEETLREAMSAMICKCGYRVIEAEDGNEAVIKFNMHRDKIDLVLMDVIMPDKSGKEAYDELKAVQPDLKVIFMSGHAGDVLTNKKIEGEGLYFIAKPMSPAELFSKVREALGKTSQKSNIAEIATTDRIN